MSLIRFVIACSSLGLFQLVNLYVNITLKFVFTGQCHWRRICVSLRLLAIDHTSIDNPLQVLTWDTE